MKERVVLSANPAINQFVQQGFPVVDHIIDGNIHSKSVTVIEYLSSHQSFECSSFCVEIVKDYDGHVSYILKGSTFGENNIEVWILRTDDFNCAYDLKNRLDTLLGRAPSKYQLMPCYGSLQREKLCFEDDYAEK